MSDGTGTGTPASMAASRAETAGRPRAPVSTAANIPPDATARVTVGPAVSHDGGMPVARRLWTRAAWAAALPTAGVAAARAVGFDRHPALCMANAGTHFVYLPAWGALAVGLRARRPGLTAVAGAVVAAHVAWTLPELRGRRRTGAVAGPGGGGGVLACTNREIGDSAQASWRGRGRRGPAPGPGLAGAGGAGGARFRLVTSNVRAHSPDSTALGEELAALDADVLLLQELSIERLTDIKAAGAFDRYPYSFVDARPGSFGSGIWSKFPLEGGEGFEPGGPPRSRATIDVGGTKVRVFNVHAKAPVRRRWIGMWKSHLAALEGEFTAAFAQGPVILAGDFNSTLGHEPFRRLLAAGLRDAHVDVGRWLARTWPRPSLFRIDHVLLSEGVEAVSVREGVGRSSDHRPVVAELALAALPARPGLPQLG